MAVESNHSSAANIEQQSFGSIPAYAVPVEELCAQFSSSTKEGLSESDAAIHRARYGLNQLTEAPPTPVWRKILSQFNGLVIWILIVAAIISGVMGEWADSVAILAIVLINGIIGFVQEERAQKALAALQKLSAPLAKVVRGGVLKSLPAAELVPGDRIEIEAGDNIPADARLIDAFSLRIQEASLTGESTPVEKDARVILSENTALADRLNMVYLGTVAAAGKANALVVATGMQSELGRIAGLLDRQPAEPTPLQRRLAELGRVLVYVCLLLVAIVFLLELRRGGRLLDLFLVSVSLAVAAVPEGLPAVVTVALALGLQRMAKRNALVRRLPSVETLGSVTVICSDKTGTLTRNEMTVRAIIAGNIEYRVTGSGYAPHGKFYLAGTPESLSGRLASDVADPQETSTGELVEQPNRVTDLSRLMTAAARCNNAKITPSADDRNTWQVIGDPTEGALLTAAMKAGIDVSPNGSRLISEIPFDSQRKAMSVVIREADGSEVIYTKGAPEVVLAMCNREFCEGTERPLTEQRRQQIGEQNTALAQRALRVLALACRVNPKLNGDRFAEQDLIFLGVAGMIDPPREEAKEAVRSCHTAGIRPIMITGDHPATARAIAEELGILAQRDQVVSGQELEATSDEDLAARVDQISVYARVSAEHKLRVVRAWQRRGHVVAMTGDGVNDAPAVKAADIGIAMGVSGTDVTKEASDMVLTDDNFKSIVSAVEEGRSIFDNIRNFIYFLLACNAGEVLFMFFAAVVGWPVPLAAIQILWINLVTDGFPALALAMEPPDRDIMKRAPRPPREPVITLRRGLLLLAHGVLIAGATSIGFWSVYQGIDTNFEHARTVAFCTLVFAQLLFSFACRSERRTLPELGLFTNPYLCAAIALSALLQFSVILIPYAQPVFEVSSHPMREWLLVFGLALAPVTVIEMAKLVVAGTSRLHRTIAIKAEGTP